MGGKRRKRTTHVWALLGYDHVVNLAADLATVEFPTLSRQALPAGALASDGFIEVVRCVPITRWPVWRRATIIEIAKNNERRAQARLRLATGG